MQGGRFASSQPGSSGGMGRPPGTAAKPDGPTREIPIQRGMHHRFHRHAGEERAARGQDLARQMPEGFWLCYQGSAGAKLPPTERKQTSGAAPLTARGRGWLSRDKRLPGYAEFSHTEHPKKASQLSLPCRRATLQAKIKTVTFQQQKTGPGCSN